MSWSNQWNACAEVTTSADAVGSGIASAFPRARELREARRLELGAHLVQRLDRGNAVPEGDERACELSRPGAEIDDVGRLVADEPAHGFVRVPRAAALVRASDVGEGRVRPARLRVAVDDHAQRV